MSKPAKPPFSQLLDGRPANGFDAKTILAERREARRQIPFTPILRFGLPLSEKIAAPVEWTGAAESAGADILKL